MENRKKRKLEVDATCHICGHGYKDGFHAIISFTRAAACDRWCVRFGSCQMKAICSGQDQIGFSSSWTQSMWRAGQNFSYSFGEPGFSEMIAFMARVKLLSSEARFSFKAIGILVND
uniref:Uncharacterized protein n=1 Tax=Oryza sativa subsp. japonica TaxID=39947 RepID=Q2QWG2_ORYSJ|nr:hypothetical protein LOC_Os12g09450 [Oryza sativa Japonica Group]